MITFSSHKLPKHQHWSNQSVTSIANLWNISTFITCSHTVNLQNWKEQYATDNENCICHKPLH